MRSGRLRRNGYREKRGEEASFALSQVCQLIRGSLLSLPHPQLRPFMADVSDPALSAAIQVREVVAPRRRFGEKTSR